MEKFIPYSHNILFILDQDSACRKSPLHRQSCSAPARISLDRLEAATESLGRRVLSLSKLVKRSSSDEGLTDVPSLAFHPVNSLVNLVVDTMVRTCHGCHAPLDEDHQEYPSGWQKCQLEHWDGCQGGIADMTAVKC